MSLQITSGVGSSVPSQTVAPTSNTGSSGQTNTIVPQYQLEFTGLSRASALGLAAPSSAGDLEVLFARIATALKDALGQLSDMDDVAKAERFRGRLGQAMAAFDQMFRWGQTIDINRENIKNQTDIEDRETKIRDDATTARDSLRQQRGPLQDRVNANTTAIQNLQTSNNALAQERSGLLGEQNTLGIERQGLVNERGALLANPVQNANRINQINTRLTAIDTRLGQINTRIGQINSSESAQLTEIGSRQSENVQLNQQLASLDGQIAAKGQEIDRAQSNINAAISSRNESQRTVRNTLDSMDSFIGNTIELMLVASGNTRADMGRAAGQITTEGDFFEGVLQDMARALVSLGSNLLQSQRDVDVALHTGGAGLNQTQSTPDRFGQLSAPVARAIAFAGMIAGVLGAVADLMNSLSRGLGMQTAGTMATAGEPRVRVGL